MEFDPINLVLCIALIVALIQKFSCQQKEEHTKQVVMELLAWIYLHNNAELPGVDEVRDAYTKVFEEENKKCQVQ